MKLSTTPSKIVGVTLGELHIELLRSTGIGIGLRAKFGLVDKEGQVNGFMDVATGWSEKLEAPLLAFVAALEEEGLRLVFEPGEGAETPETTAKAEPPQF